MAKIDPEIAAYARRMKQEEEADDVALDAERTDDLLVGLDDPKSVPLGFREDAMQLSQLSIDRGRNVLLEQLAPGGANSRLTRVQSAATGS